MYVVELTFTKPIDAVNAQVQAHLDYLDENYAKKLFIASGPKNPRDGGVILASAKLSRGELDELIAQDPFHQNDLAEYRVIDVAVDKFDPAIAAVV